MREQLRDSHRIIGKAAACEHDTAIRTNFGVAAGFLHDGADHPPFLDQQLAHWRRYAQVDAAVERRSGEPRDERIAVDELHAAPMHDEIDHVPRQRGA